MDRALKNFKAIAVISLLLLIFSSLTWGESISGSLSIDHAYLRRPIPEFDPGTIHMFLKNEGRKPITVTRIYINDIPLPSEITAGASSIWEGLLPEGIPPPIEGRLDDRFIWHRVLPNPIGSGKVADVMVKLASPTQQVIKIEAETADGQRLHRIIQPIDNPFRITFIGFSDELDKVYIYLQNNWDKPLTVSKVFLDTEDISSRCIIPWKGIPAGVKRCIVAKLKKPLPQGEYIAIKIPSNEEDLIKAEAVVRAFSFFPIDLEGGGTKPGLNLNPELFIIPFSDNLSPVRRLRNVSAKAYHLLNCPTHAHGSLRNAARKIISKGNGCREADPSHPTHLGICRENKEHGYFLFGELADIIQINPNQRFFNLRWVSEKKEHYTQWLTDLAKKACEPRPVYTIPVVTKNRPYFTKRYPTLGEVRLMVYYELSRGSKGIFYRGCPADKELEEEICRINGELQILKDFLKIGDSVPLAESSDPEVEANSILCGQEAIILILINQDNVFRMWHPFSFKPKQNFTVTVHIPKWMRIKRVSEVGGRYERLKYTKKANNIIIPIDELELTKQIVLVAK